VRGDLIRIIEGLMKRKGRFDAIIVETTGLADPAPVAQTFFVDEDVREAARLDAVVTVADAKWLAQRLRDAPEAKNQIAFADVIIINKTDLVSAAELREVEARIRAINPYAALHRAKKCDVPIADVLERRAFDLDRILDIEPDFLVAGDHDHGHDHEHDDGHHHHGLKHYHDEDMQSVAIRLEGDVDPAKFMPWINRVTQEQGLNILRCKGIVAMKGDPKRFVFQGVHMMLDGDSQREWKPDEKRESKVVFIGRDLAEEDIRNGFLACAA
jgi:G3E family GTPase